VIVAKKFCLPPYLRGNGIVGKSLDAKEAENVTQLLDGVRLEKKLPLEEGKP